MIINPRDVVVIFGWHTSKLHGKTRRLETFAFKDFGSAEAFFWSKSTDSNAWTKMRGISGPPSVDGFLQLWEPTSVAVSQPTLAELAPLMEGKNPGALLRRLQVLSASMEVTSP